jgi:DNA modification methylase
MDLATIYENEKDLTTKFRHKLRQNNTLTRALVSFQANKGRSAYRWFKFREGFSAPLIHYIFDQLHIDKGRILDPFAGAGTALFVASERGLDATGIELLPIGQAVIEARRIALNGDVCAIAADLERWRRTRPWTKNHASARFPHLRITEAAFPAETEQQIAAFVAQSKNEQRLATRKLLRFAALCVLEDTSYTRKDGQYLRWDYRSGRRQGTKQFDKGSISKFESAIDSKLEEIISDLTSANAPPDDLFPVEKEFGRIHLLRGSTLDLLPKLRANSFSAVITSPPYCNRYDYTRTYALELALLGVTESQLRRLRQTMLSCTVENREKVELLKQLNPRLLERAKKAFEEQVCLRSILSYLYAQRLIGKLNNPGIPRMVRNYFWEMAVVICQLARVLAPSAPLIMVNDNVRYAGADIPVDLILSDIAEKCGFELEKIWVLPMGKGNSSQQMGTHGRTSLRKCVYVWRSFSA